jgi:hypothetical protein
MFLCCKHKGENMNKAEIIDATLDGKQIQELVNLITNNVNNPIVLISKNFKIIAHSNLDMVIDETWLSAMERGFITLEFGFNLNNWSKFEIENKNYIEFAEISKSKRRFYKLQFKNNFLGYLNVLEQIQDLSTIEDNDYDFIVKVLSKEIYMKATDIHTFHQFTNEDILFSLHNEEFRSEFHFLQRVDNLKINNHKNYQIVVIDIDKHTSFNADNDNLKQKILSNLKDCVIINELNYLYILSYNNNFVINQEVKKFLISNKLKLNISSSFSNLFDYKIYENEAIDALNLNKFIEDDTLITYFDDVKIFKILTTYPFKRDYINYLDDKIIEIVSFDKAHNSDLLDTLYAYLKYEKSVKIVASKLYIHRNTVNYRIRQLKEKFNVNFDDFHSLMKLYISIELYFIHEKKLD